MTKETYLILVQADVLPAHRQAVLSAAKINLPFTLAEPGCEAFFQTVMADDPNKLVFFEVFSSEQTHAFHMTQDYTKAFFSAIEGKLAAPPTITRLTLV